MSQPGQPPPYSAHPQLAQAHFVHGATVVQMQPTAGANIIVINKSMGPEPVSVVCSNCNTTIVTRTDGRPTVRTHLWALMLFVFGCWPCMCIPYCMPSCMNVDHHCPVCNTYVGSYRG